MGTSDKMNKTIALKLNRVLALDEQWGENGNDMDIGDVKNCGYGLIVRYIDVISY